MPRYLRAATVGVVGFLGVLGTVTIACIYFGFAPMAADNAPSALEANLAMKAVHAVSEREMGERKNPLLTNVANLDAGLRIYGHNCLMCHGAADGKATSIAQGFYIPSPQFASDGVQDDPEGATYWKIHHGIRFTAMPAFHASLSRTQMWQVAMFLKHMDELPKPVEVAWKALKSAAPADATARSPKRMDM